jgi:hypothetical protein
MANKGVDKQSNKQYASGIRIVRLPEDRASMWPGSSGESWLAKPN